MNFEQDDQNTRIATLVQTRASQIPCCGSSKEMRFYLAQNVLNLIFYLVYFLSYYVKQKINAITNFFQAVNLYPKLPLFGENLIHPMISI